MSNPWIGVARVLIPLEGLAGMILNLVLIFYLSRTNIGQAARLYYYSSIVAAINSFYTALGILVTINLPTMVDGNLIGIFYGPLLFYFPKWANDAICVAFFSQLHTMFQMIPAPSILQWFAVTKSDRGKLTKLIVAYALPVTFNVITWIQMPAFLASDALRNHVSAIVERLYGTNSSEFHVFAIPVLDKVKYDAIDLAIFDIIPSYLVSYALFAISAYKIKAYNECYRFSDREKFGECLPIASLTILMPVTYQIRGKLDNLGASISKKTQQMQRRFLYTQIAQVLLPLVLMSVPMIVLFIFVFLGRELHNLPFLIGYMMWPMPMLTALLLLAFVRKSAVSSTNAISKLSLSKNSNANAKTSTSVAPMQQF